MKTIISLVFLLHSILTALAERPTRVCTGSLKDPLPSRLYCGSHGTLPNPSNFFRYDNESSADACRDFCLSYAPDDGPRKTACISYAYDAFGLTCSLYKRNLRNMGYKGRPTQQDVYYYNRRCYNVGPCRCVLAQDVEPVQDNLVLNPSFEVGGPRGLASDGSLYYNYNCTRGGSYPFDGEGFLTLEKFTAETSNVGYSQPSPANTGPYIFSFRYRGACPGNSSCSLRPFYRVSDTLSITLDTIEYAAETPKDEEWKLYTGTIPEGEVAKVGVRQYGGSSVFDYDKVTLVVDGASEVTKRKFVQTGLEQTVTVDSE